MLPAPNPIGCKELIQKHMDAGPTTVCMADADGLKGINDSHGHMVGDEYLGHIFQTLQQCFPEFTWDRYGGDEFVGVSPGNLAPLAPDADRAVRDTVQIADETIKVGYSLGVVHTAPNDTVELAIAMADAAMYEAKRFHHGGLLMFEPSKKVGLIGLDWGMEWYSRPIKDKVRFFLGYEFGDVDFIFTKDRLIQDGIYVKTPKELRQCIAKQEESESCNILQPDEFSEWGQPIENLEWRSKSPESEWGQTKDFDQGVKLDIEIGNKQPKALAQDTIQDQPKLELKKEFKEKPLKKLKTKKGIEFKIPSLPSLPSFRTDKGDSTQESIMKGNPVFLGKILWIWGESAHKVDYVLAKYLAQTNQVLYLDGDFENPQHPGDWSVCWVLNTPARPPSDPNKEKNLTTWGLGKRPPRLSAIKSLWDNALYSLVTVDRTIIVGAGRMGPPPHVDAILYVTEEDALLAYPAVAIKPSDSMSEIVRKVAEVFEKTKVVY